MVKVTESRLYQKDKLHNLPIWTMETADSRLQLQNHLVGAHSIWSQPHMRRWWGGQDEVTLLLECWITSANNEKCPRATS